MYVTINLQYLDSAVVYNMVVILRYILFFRSFLCAESEVLTLFPLLLMCPLVKHSQTILLVFCFHPVPFHWSIVGHLRIHHQLQTPLDQTCSWSFDHNVFNLFFYFFLGFSSFLPTSKKNGMEGGVDCYSSSPMIQIFDLLQDLLWLSLKSSILQK